ncbi:hypothetical protein MMC20_000421 [Loxospora ochrophaea]|nr:hypothetical protein [Loxospora ochrophaea]
MSKKPRQAPKTQLSLTEVRKVIRERYGLGDNSDSMPPKLLRKVAAKLPKQSEESVVGKKRKLLAFVVTLSLRLLSLRSMSVLLGKFQAMRDHLELTSLATDIGNLRDQCFNAQHFLKSVHRSEEDDYQTSMERLRFMTYGSLKLRVLLSYLAQNILPATDLSKLLCLEAFPNAAWLSASLIATAC